MKKKSKISFIIVLCLTLLLGIVASSVFYSSSNSTLTTNMSKKEAEIAGLNSQIAKIKATMASNDSAVNAMNSATSANNSTINFQNDRIKQLEDQVAILEAKNSVVSAPASSVVPPNGSSKVNLPVAAKPVPQDGTRVAYLTFDDGPSVNTPKILSILTEKKATATFFVLHNKYSSYMKNIVAQGSVVGLHSYTHQYNIIYVSTAAFWKDFDLMNALIKSEIGYDVNIFRLPGGSSNTVSRRYKKGIMTTICNQATAKGLVYFDWNVDSGDANASCVPANKLIANVTNTIGNKKTINILMHDAPEKITTPQALPAIIDMLRNKGFVFKTLNSTSPPEHQKIVN